jgi:imidazolonepropionase-like amidohydrolase
MLRDQIILIRGERIEDVGADLGVPRGATAIDLSKATVLPGMIDTHVHLNTGGTGGGRTPGIRALDNGPRRPRACRQLNVGRCGAWRGP